LGPRDRASPTGKVKVMADAQIPELDLRWVRQQLDSLNHVRMTGGLSLSDEAHYGELCATELRLLAVAS